MRHSRLPGMKAKFVLLTLLAANAWPAADPPVQWVKFQDPFEHAFSADVPKGWAAKGGVFRLGYSDARPMVDLVSPDGRMNIRLGDVGIPLYSVPNQFHREGAIYDLGAQAQLTVARYRSGQEYATAYAQSRFKNLCTSFTAQAPSSQPPVHDSLPEDVAPQRSSTGQAGYVCGSGRDAKIAYVYAKTALYQGFWTVRTLGSFSAPSDQVSLARAILLRCSESFRISPEWTQRQRQFDQEALIYQQQRQQNRRRAISMQVAQFEAGMRAMQNQVNSFERGQARQAAQVESVGNILTGITPTVDPYGNPRNVWTGAKNGYWTNGTGQVINSDISPGPGWQPLQVRQ